MEEKKKFDGGKVIVTTILVLVTAATFMSIGYFAGTNVNKNTSDLVTPTTSTTAVTKKSASVTTTTSATTASATADWKTYTNEKYGFSFKYPSDWTISEKTYAKPGDKVLTIISPDTAKMIADRTKNPFTTEDISIRFATMPVTDSTSNTISVWMTDQLTNSITAKNKSSESINGAQAYGGEMQADPNYYAMLVQAENGLFALDFGADTSKKSDLSVEVKGILSTFQFTK